MNAYKAQANTLQRQRLQGDIFFIAKLPCANRLILNDDYIGISLLYFNGVEFVFDKKIQYTEKYSLAGGVAEGILVRGDEKKILIFNSENNNAVILDTEEDTKMDIFFPFYEQLKKLIYLWMDERILLKSGESMLQFTDEERWENINIKGEKLQATEQSWLESLGDIRFIPLSYQINPTESTYWGYGIDDVGYVLFIKNPHQELMHIGLPKGSIVDNFNFAYKYICYQTRDEPITIKNIKETEPEIKIINLMSVRNFEFISYEKDIIWVALCDGDIGESFLCWINIQQVIESNATQGASSIIIDAEHFNA